jgi:hypothetical protein
MEKIFGVDLQFCRSPIEFQGTGVVDALNAEMAEDIRFRVGFGHAGRVLMAAGAPKERERLLPDQKVRQSRP